jgi:uncharacterized YkwD family protein/spore coat assembly protein SafA
MKAMKFLFIILASIMFIAFPVKSSLLASAASIEETPIIETDDDSITTAATVYTVRGGDSLWKIAVKYEVGLKELITANPQIANPALIYVGQKINIPSAAPLLSTESEVLRLINVERSKNGLQTLSYNWEAARVARIKSQDMINNNYFSHTSPIYGSPFKMLESYGLRFSAAAENIAYGQRTAQEVVNSWMKSPGHRANILSRGYTHTGVGVAKKANGTLYFTQVFLKPY